MPQTSRSRAGAGNWNRLDQARQQGFYQQALQDLARADLRALLGIAEETTKVRLAERLPELPAAIVALPNLETTAMQKRIYPQMRRAELDELAGRLKLSKATRFINVLDAGPARVRIYVTNRLPEHTSIHWHGQRLPNGMDGVAGLNQPAIKRPAPRRCGRGSRCKCCCPAC